VPPGALETPNTTDDTSELSERLRTKANERTTLTKGELWTLRVAAAAGVAGLLSHAADLAGKLLDLF
jgi:hypothetical protein